MTTALMLCSGDDIVSLMIQLAPELAAGMSLKARG